MTARDLLYEFQFLKEVERVAERRFGIPAEGYVDRVKRRLEVGAERYGDDDFLGKDMIRELLEETPDIGGHCVLEAQKQLADDDPDESKAWHLFEAAIHGAAADYHARMARVTD